MFELSADLVALLVLAAFTAGFVDSIAGGGGLITIPALLLAGLPPVHALGTNKLQGLFGSGSATLAYAAKGHVDLRGNLLPAALSFLGSLAGAALATIVPGDVLKAILPFLLVAMALYFALKPDAGEIGRIERMRPLLFGATVIPLIGFYDGLFGPGAGSFFMLSYVALAGFGLLRATATTKFMNFASNVGGLLGFALAGAILWKVGLAMGAAQFAGARLGATLAMRSGARIIRPLLVIVCIVVAVRLIADPTNPLRIWAGF